MRSRSLPPIVALGVAGLALVIVSACGSFGTDGDGPRADASAAEVAADVSPGAEDAAPAPDAAACPGFEEHFDNPAVPPPGWVADNGTPPSSTITAPDSGPLPGAPALLATVLVGDAGAGRSTISRTFPLGATVSSVDLSFALYIDKAETFAELGCNVRFEVDGANPYAATRVGLETRNSSTELAVDESPIGYDAGGLNASEVSVSALPLGQWTDITLHVDVDQARGKGNASATSAVRGGTRSTRSVTEFAMVKGYDAVRVQCGIAAVGSGPGTFALLLDDVVARICP